MNVIGEFAKRIVGDMVWAIDWSLSNWAITAIVLIAMLYGAGRQRRLGRYHL